MSMRLTANDLYLLGQCAISAACQSGHLIARHSSRDLAINIKESATSLAAQVVTEVDHLSQDIILQILQPVSEVYDIAILSEESTDNLERLHKDFFWSIDPLDGTLPFIESVPGYSVSIALVSRCGIPLIGVVYDPLSQSLYSAIKDQGARINGQLIRLPVSHPEIRQPLTFISDKSFAQDPRYLSMLAGLDGIATDLRLAAPKLMLQGGAAMNACQVLTRSPACYCKLPKTQTGGGSIWDYAATACLFQEMGMPVSDIYGNPLELNPNGSTFMNHCGVLYCSEPAIAEKMIRLYQTLGDASL